jgi:hypothetical protein
MKRLVALATFAALIAAPVAAQSLSILLPAITFPDPVVTTSTKDCAPTLTAVCPPRQSPLPPHRLPGRTVMK